MVKQNQCLALRKRVTKRLFYGVERGWECEPIADKTLLVAEAAGKIF